MHIIDVTKKKLNLIECLPTMIGLVNTLVFIFLFFRTFLSDNPAYYLFEVVFQFYLLPSILIFLVTFISWKNKKFGAILFIIVGFITLLFFIYPIYLFITDEYFKFKLIGSTSVFFYFLLIFISACSHFIAGWLLIKNSNKESKR
jgi:hypothetical protein